MNNKRIRNLSLVLITDRSQCKRQFLDTIKQAIKGGVNAVQLREKGLSTCELYSLANELRKITRDFGVSLIINDRVDIALAVQADGVHLGWQSLPFGVVRGLLDAKMFIGISTHNRQEALQAQRLGADYITLGPIFETPSKAGILKPIGVEEIRKLKNEIELPIIALGGINGKNVECVLNGGADGVAVISSIMQADDPEDAARCLCNEIVAFKSRKFETRKFGIIF